MIVVGEEPAATELSSILSAADEPQHTCPDGRNGHDRRRSPGSAEEQQHVANLVAALPLDPLPHLLQRYEHRHRVCAENRILREAPEEPGQARLPLRSLPCGKAGGHGREEPPSSLVVVQHFAAVAPELLGGVHHRLASPVSSEHQTPIVDLNLQRSGARSAARTNAETGNRWCSRRYSPRVEVRPVSPCKCCSSPASQGSLERVRLRARDRLSCCAATSASRSTAEAGRAAGGNGRCSHVLLRQTFARAPALPPTLPTGAEQ